MGASTRTRLVAVLLIAVAALALPHAAGAATSRLYSVNRDAGIPPPEKGTVSGFTIAENGSLAELSGSPFPLGIRFPDALAITPDGTRALAADSFNSATSDPGIQGFAISPAGGLAAAQSPFTPLGGDPRNSATSPDGGVAYVTSDSGGVEAFSIAGTGALTQIGADAYGSARTDQIDLTPDGKYLFGCPSSNDLVERYSIQADRSLTPLGSTSSGTGTVDGCMLAPGGGFYYTVSSTSDTIATLTVGAGGELTPVGSPVPTGTPNAYPPAISPDGRFMYVPSQALGTVMTYAIGANGVPVLIGPGPSFPSARETAVTPDGRYIFIANRDSPGQIRGYARIADGTIGAEVASATTVGGEGEMLVIAPAQPPTASLKATAAAPKSNSTFDGAASSDSDGTVVRYDWDFGDGATLQNGGPTPLHVYARAGIYTARLTVTDDQNCSTRIVWAGFMAYCNGGPSATTTVTLDTPPLISRLSLTHRRFAVASARRKVRRNTTFRYRLSERARVRFTIARKMRGRRTRYVRVGSFSQRGRAGTNRRRFSGRIGHKRLTPGTYRATLVATDSAKGRSAPKRIRFRVVR